MVNWRLAREVERQAESRRQRGLIVVENANEKGKARCGEHAGDEPEEQSGEEIALGKQCVDKAAAPEDRKGPDGCDHEAHERRQQSGHPVRLPCPEGLELAGFAHGKCGWFWRGFCQRHGLDCADRDALAGDGEGEDLGSGSG